MKENYSSSNWDSLSSDLQEIILSYLPISSIVKASSVCKQWKSIICSNAFNALKNQQTWLFLYGQNRNYTTHDDVFAFEPQSNAWIKIPGPALLSKSSFIARNNGSLLFTKRCVNPFFEQAVSDIMRMNSVIIDEECRLSILIYDPLHDSFESYRSLMPEIFRLGNISRSLSWVLFEGKLYVHGNYWSFTSSFDLETRSWSEVKTLRPPGAVYTHLVSCFGSLVLGGLCVFSRDVTEYNLWQVDEEILEFREITKMPHDMLSRFFDAEVVGEKFPILRCVAKGNVVFLFDEERRGNREACVCEISECGDCNWRNISRFPEALVECDRIESFCADVSLLDVLGNGRV